MSSISYQSYTRMHARLNKRYSLLSLGPPPTPAKCRKGFLALLNQRKVVGAFLCFFVFFFVGIFRSTTPLKSLAKITCSNTSSWSFCCSSRKNLYFALLGAYTFTIRVLWPFILTSVATYLPSLSTNFNLGSRSLLA